MVFGLFAILTMGAALGTGSLAVEMVLGLFKREEEEGPRVQKELDRLADEVLSGTTARKRELSLLQRKRIRMWLEKAREELLEK